MIGGIWLWLLVGTACCIWSNPESIVEKPTVAARSLIVPAVWKTTITLLMWFGGLSAAPDITARLLSLLSPARDRGISGVAYLAAVPILLITGSWLIGMNRDRRRRQFARG